MSGTGAPAGWYADPQLPERLRYFDGAAWTEHVTAAPAVAPAAPAPVAAALGAPADQQAPAQQVAQSAQHAPVQQFAPAQQYAPAEQYAPAQQFAPASGVGVQTARPVLAPAAPPFGASVLPPGASPYAAAPAFLQPAPRRRGTTRNRVVGITLITIASLAMLGMAMQLISAGLASARKAAAAPTVAPGPAVVLALTSPA